MRRIARILLCGLTLALGACAPAVMGEGPPRGPARFDETAMIMPDGTALPLRSWLPKTGETKAAIVALHGMNDYANAFDDPGRYWADHGIAVYAYDQRGFGKAPKRGYWAGSETLAADAKWALGLVQARHPGKPVYLLGESMGGAVALLVMTSRERPDIAGVILSAPAVWSRDTINIFQRAALWLASHTVPWMTLTGRGLDIMPSDNIPMLRALSADPLVIKETRIEAIHGLCDLMDAALAASPGLNGPALVLYGEHDEIIPAKPTLRMMKALPGSPTRAVYGQGWHMLLRDLQAKLVMDDVLAWIERADAPLPSGADRRAQDWLEGKERGDERP